MSSFSCDSHRVYQASETDLAFMYDFLLGLSLWLLLGLLLWLLLGLVASVSELDPWIAGYQPFQRLIWQRATSPSRLGQRLMRQ